MGTEHDITDDQTRTAFRTCPLCEAGCGLEITVKGDRVTRIRGDQADVFSHGFLCPKGSTLKQLHDDPDRLRRPLVKRDGVHVEADWDEAWAIIADRLPQIIGERGRESVAVYLGNPSAHNLGALLYNRSLLQALGTRRRFSASTVDQMPRQVAAGYVFGSPVTVPVPDLDHTDYLVVMGANPYASNGSLCTAPDFPGRLEAIRARGGTLVVVDPRRSRTAEEADRWIAIRPGTDALFLAAMATAMAEEGLVQLGDHAAAHVSGVDEVVAALAPFTPEVVASATGVSADDIRRVARELCAAPSGSVYGRIGTTTTEFGTITSWLIDVVNTFSGNLDRRGGAMFPKPVAGSGNTRGRSGTGKGFSVGRGHTQVRQLPEVMGEYPASAMAEEITAAADPVRALITVAGNPVLSTPNSDQLDAAFGQLEFMVSVDIYLNETTKHADVILPPPSQLQRGHYDLALLGFAVRNVANYSEPVLPIDEGAPDEWEILAKLGLIAAGLGPDADPAVADDLGLAGMVQQSVGDPGSPIHGRAAEEILAELGTQAGPERMLDFMLQTGPYGAGFGANPGGASVALLKANPHGVDYGPLQPRLPEVLRTPSGTVELAHPVLLGDLARLAAAIDRFAEQPLVLVGRRHLRSNNSWMHNIEVLVKGKPRCTLHVHPDDAHRLGLADGGVARITSRVGTVDAPVEVTDEVRPGVVSLPHGWGHDQPGTRMRVAAERAGVNSNVLADHEALDPLSGTSVLNGIPVDISPV
ncbi:MAG: molybdopterin-dependent oxidoreductase [Actinobacteria bacterium]|nr:molybdopterin-dependent oxidoreductase [Actinomycetota bacterium]